VSYEQGRVYQTTIRRERIIQDPVWWRLVSICFGNKTWHFAILFVSRCCILPNSREQSPSWIANSHSASQEILCLSWNHKVDYRVHNSLPLVPVLSLMKLVHTLPPYFSDIDSDSIFPFMSRSSQQSLPFRFSNRTLVCISHLSHACYMTHLFHPP
jgi:hypothetical protein